MKKEEISELYVQQARQLEAKGRFKDAERFVSNTVSIVKLIIDHEMSVFLSPSSE